jgi:pimeloyl-ACP methyl ester carboxylesterase
VLVEHVRAAGVDVEVARTTGAGPTIVLLHGNFATWRWWRLAMELVGSRATLIAPTMRGCRGTRGSSSTGTWSMPSLAADLEAVVSALGLDTFHLVGHSLGGAIAQQYVLDCPGRVTRLDLVSPAPGDAMESMLARDSAGGRLLRSINPNRALDRASLLMWLRIGRDLGTNRRSLRKTLLGLMPGADLTRVQFESLLDDGAQMEPVAVVGLYRELSNWDLRERRRELTLPIRVLAGGRDPLIPLPALEELARELPQAKLRVIDGGHSPMLEHPEAFAEWLLEP